MRAPVGTLLKLNGPTAHLGLVRLTSRHDPPIFTPMGEYKSRSLDELFGAIADPTRRAILDRLARGEARVTEVAADFPISEAARWIDHHRRFWEDSLSRLDAFVQSSAPRKPAPTRKPRKKKP